MSNQLKGYEKRKRVARAFWATVVKENEVMTPSEIAKRHINPKTRKHYTREHIHWILKNADKI